MKNKILKVNNSTLNYYDTCEKEKKAIILIHGLTGNHYQLQFFRNNLKDKYRIIEIDVRGRGNSGRGEEKSSIFEHKNDIIKLIKELHLERPIIIGYSMGGYIASLVAAETKIDKLILLDSAAQVEDYQDKIVVPTFGRLKNKYNSKEDYVETIVGNYSRMSVADSKELRDAVRYEVTKKEDGYYNKSVKENIESDWASMRNFSVQEVFNNIYIPVLLIQCKGKIGEVGPLFDEIHYELTKKYIRNLEVFNSQTNHYTLVFEKQPEINSKIDNFLERN